MRAVRVASCHGEEAGVDAIVVPIDADGERLADEPV
jgi:hypothetical protein